MHSTGSDGKLTPEEMIIESIEKKLSFICFTDHYFYPPEFNNNPPWNHFHNNEYFKNIQDLKEKYKDKIEISLGAEFNWLRDYTDWIKDEIGKRDYDYCLASVHMIPIKDEYIPLNWNEDNFIESINKSGGIENLIKEYYNETRKLAQSELFDTIAHFDLIKMFNRDNKFFKEHKEYKNIVYDALDVISNNNICIEINTSGWKYSCNEQFPSYWILKKMKRLNIPITIGTDSHDKDHIDTGIKEAIRLAKNAGYDNILKFKNRKRIKIPI